MVQPELLSDRLTSHRYVAPMKPDSLQTGITASSTAASANSGLVSHFPPAKARVDLLATKSQRLRHGYPTNIRNELAQKAPKCYVPTSLPPKASSDATDEATDDATKEAVKTAVDTEAAVPNLIPGPEKLLNELINIAKERPALLRSADQEFPVPGTAFTICCNNCDAAIPDAHWHCSICDEGDFDLCGECVEKGVLCDTADHWLIKRFVQDGKVINSTTETMAPTKSTNDESEKEVPGAFTSENKEPQLQETTEESRTCNSCVQGDTYIRVPWSMALIPHSFQRIKLCHLHRLRGLRPLYPLPCRLEAWASPWPQSRASLQKDKARHTGNQSLRSWPQYAPFCILR